MHEKSKTRFIGLKLMLVTALIAIKKTSKSQPSALLLSRDIQFWRNLFFRSFLTVWSPFFTQVTLIHRFADPFLKGFPGLLQLRKPQEGNCMLMLTKLHLKVVFIVSFSRSSGLYSLNKKHSLAIRWYDERRINRFQLWNFERAELQVLHDGFSA